MSLHTGISRTITIAAVSLAALAGTVGVASAEVVPPTPRPWGLPPWSESSYAVGDNAACRIDYRIWVETADPGHLTVSLQSTGIDTLPTGSTDPDSCGQWMVVRWNSADANDIRTLQGGEQQVYLRATRTPSDPITFDIDVTRLPPGTTAEATMTVFSRAAYVPFVAWVEPSVLVPYRFTV